MRSESLTEGITREDAALGIFSGQGTRVNTRGRSLAPHGGSRLMEYTSNIYGVSMRDEHHSSSKLLVDSVNVILSWFLVHLLIHRWCKIL
jgi:hypothetical protein